MHLNGRPVANFDPEVSERERSLSNKIDHSIFVSIQGLIFGAGVTSEMIKLYDLRSFDKVIFLSCIFFKEQSFLHVRVLFLLFNYPKRKIVNGQI